ncbi:MAG: protein kinase [Candidatus Aureabacteria bacterium]|nr:protein kinase [Candidatus Auribacterota bacterium]
MKEETFVENSRPSVIQHAEWRKGDVVLNLYEVREILGEGGMGKVYKVWHRNWNRFLAVKTPKWEIFENPDFKKGFILEAETWVNLDLHSNVVTCYYVSEINNIPRIFIEYLEGGTLKDWIRHDDKKKNLYLASPDATLEKIIDIAIQAGWGLLHAHQHQIVHQDMKPENILMTPEGTAKVTDFGLTRAAKIHIDRIDSSEGKSVLATFGGMTPSYCSPEQSRREKVTRRSDLWSWAVTVLEMFVGGVEWPSGTLAGKVLEIKLASNSFLIPMPDLLAGLLKRCFKINPDERPHSMEEVVKELRDIYIKLFHKSYPRNQPGRIQAKSDMLNNRALSMIDMGKIKEAEYFFQESLKVNPHHPETIYNMGLLHYYSKDVPLTALMSDVSEATLAPASKPWIKEYLFGLICMEENEMEAAKDHLHAAVRLGGGREIREALHFLEKQIVRKSGSAVVYQTGNDSIQSLCFFPDGTKALSGNMDGSLMVWDLFTDKAPMRWEGHQAQISVILIHGPYAVTGSYDHTIRIWDWASGKCVQVLKGHSGPVLCLSVSKNMQYLLSGSADRTLRLWEIKTGTNLKVFSGHKHWVLYVKLYEDFFYCCSGSLDGIFHVWDVKSGKIVHDINLSVPWVYSMDVTSDKRTATVAGWDQQIQLWEIEKGERYQVLTGHEDRINCVSVSHDNKWCVSGSNDKTIRLWNLLNGKCVQVLEGHLERVTCVAWNPANNMILSGGPDHTMRLWDLSFFSSSVVKMRAPYVFCPAIDPEHIKRAQTKFVNTLYHAKSLSEEGKLDEALRLIEDARRSTGYERDMETLCLRVIMGFKTRRALLDHIWKLFEWEGHQDKISVVRIVKDGRYVISGSLDKKICIWDTGTGQCVTTCSGHSGEIISVDITKDLRYFLSCSTDKTMRLWDFYKGEMIREWISHAGGFTFAVFSHDGMLVASSGYDRILRVWHRLSGQELLHLSGHTDNVSSVVFSPDNRFLLSCGWDAALYLWDIRQGKSIRSFRGHTDYIHMASFNLDGSLAVSSSADKTVRVWDVESGGCLQVFDNHSESVNIIRFTADGRFIVSASSDKTLRFWSVESGQCVFAQQGEEPFYAMDLSQDGRFLVTAHSKVLQLYELDWSFVAVNEGQEEEVEKKLDSQLRIFLINHTDYLFQPEKDQHLSKEQIVSALIRQDHAHWNDKDFKQLLIDLSSYGLGWVNPEKVSLRLDELNKQMK